MINFQIKILENKIYDLKEHVKNPEMKWAALYAHYYAIPLKDYVEGIYLRTKNRTLILNGKQEDYLKFIKSVLIKNQDKQIDKVNKTDLKKEIKVWGIVSPRITSEYPHAEWALIYKNFEVIKRWPNFLKEINFRIVHEIIKTKVFLNKKHGFFTGSGRECRLCGKSNEDLKHILNDCSNITALKQYFIGQGWDRNRFLGMVLIKYGTPNIEELYAYTIYRKIVIEIWQRNTLIQANGYINLYKSEWEKYKSILEE